MPKAIEDLTGRRFGMLTAIRFVKVQSRHAYWEFRCDCGKTKVRMKPFGNEFASCGCVKVKKEEPKELSYVSSPEADDWMFGDSVAIKRLRRMFK